MFLFYIYLFLLNIMCCYSFILFPVLSHRIAELGALVGHTGQRIDSVEMNNKQLGKTRRFFISICLLLFLLIATFCILLTS